MVTPQAAPAAPGHPDSGTFDRARVIRSACLERCETMARESYDWGPVLSTRDWLLTVIVAAVFLALMYLGPLV